MGASGRSQRHRQCASGRPGGLHRRSVCAVTGRQLSRRWHFGLDKAGSAWCRGTCGAECSPAANIEAVMPTNWATRTPETMIIVYNTSGRVCDRGAKVVKRPIVGERKWKVRLPCVRAGGNKLRHRRRDPAPSAVPLWFLRLTASASRFRAGQDLHSPPPAPTAQRPAERGFGRLRNRPGSLARVRLGHGLITSSKPAPESTPTSSLQHLRRVEPKKMISRISIEQSILSGAS